MTRKTDQPPELLNIAEDADRVEATRRRLCRERCEAMEDRLREIGFSPDTSYWSVAMLITRLSDGWRPLERSLDRLANDRDIATRSKRLDSRRRIVRRAIAELEAWDLISVERSGGAARRATRPHVNYHITLNRPLIVGEIPLRDADNAADNTPDSLTDNAADNTPDNSGTVSGQTRKHSIYPPNNPNPIGPPSPLGRDIPGDISEEREDQKFAVTRAAIEPVAVRICRAIRWPDEDCETVWRVAAAFSAGLIVEADIAIACRLAQEKATRSRVGYFRTKLAERLGLDESGMRELLGRCRCSERFPTVPPARPGSQVCVTIQQPPRGSGVDWNDRRNGLLAACQEAE